MSTQHELEVEGRLAAIERGQQDLIHAVTAKLDDHETRVRALERVRNMLAGAGVLVGAAWAALKGNH